MSVLDKNIEVSDQNFDYNKEDALEALKKEFGQQFSNSKSVREQHTDTTTIHTSKLPDGVVFAENESDVKKTIEICNEYKCPIIPVRVERTKGAYFKVSVYPPINNYIHTDKITGSKIIMTKINEMLENWIEERPEQWLWVHKRWPNS